MIAVLPDDGSDAIDFGHGPNDLRRHQIDDSDPATEAKTSDATPGPE